MSDDRSDRFVAALEQVPSCWTCLHKSTLGPTCTAFPSGIPDVILSGENPHTEPYPGDRGITYLAED